MYRWLPSSFTVVLGRRMLVGVYVPVPVKSQPAETILPVPRRDLSLGGEPDPMAGS